MSGIAGRTFHGARQERQVAEITDSDCFRSLRARVSNLRRTLDE